MIKNNSIKVGFSFGLTSGIITTLGLIMGVYSISPSVNFIIGSILTIAIADAFSDSLGIHISQESENVHSSKDIWLSTASTFLSKFVFAMTFIIPFVIFSISTAITVSIVWGLSLLGIFSYVIAKEQHIKPVKIISEHIIIAIIVLFATNYVGKIIGHYFENGV